MQHTAGKQAAGGPDAGAVQAFSSTLRGELIGPSDDGYESARKVYNAMIDRRPRLIAKVADVADVITCVNFGRDENLRVAVRGGFCVVVYLHHRFSNINLSSMQISPVSDIPS